MKASLAVQACHAWLIRHCARRENGGTITACGGWMDRDWGIATNGQLRRRDVQAVVDAGLANWEGADLVVHGYDAIGQVECIRERKRAKDWRDKQRAKRHGTDKGTEDGADTPPRTRTVRLRESDQSSPDQSSPSEERAGGREDPEDLTTPRASPVIDDADRWLHERIAPWAASLLAAGAKIGPRNWRRWHVLVHGSEVPPVQRAHGLGPVLTAVAATPASERWPDHVETRIASQQGQESLSTATAHKVHKIKL